MRITESEKGSVSALAVIGVLGLMLLATAISLAVWRSGQIYSELASINDQLMVQNKKVEEQANPFPDDKWTAIFLDGGQVYFGKVRESNENSVKLTDIYYLKVGDDGADINTGSMGGEDISLAKLGCELHGPKDAMNIRADKITFWEELKDDGQVVKAIDEFMKQNPGGQTNCAV